MDGAVIFAFLAMLCWGLCDFLSKVIVDRLGPRRTAFLIPGVSAAALLAAFLLLRAPVPQITLKLAILVILSSALAFVAFLSMFTGMHDGKASIAQPIASCWIGITVLLSVVFLGERLSPAAAAAIALLIAGVFLLSAPEKGKLGRDALFGIVAMLAWGVGQFLLKPAADAGGILFTSVAVSVAAIPLYAAVALTEKRAGGKKREDARLPLLLGVLAGLLNAVGFYSYVSAIAGAGVSIPSAITAGGPLIVVVLSMAFLGERLSRWQAAGAGLAIAGLAIVGF